MTAMRSCTLVVSMALLLLLTGAAQAQEEKDPAALWSDFSNAVKQGQADTTRQAAAALLGSRRLDDRRYLNLVNNDAEHNALFLQGIQNDKTRDATGRVLERYISIQAQPQVAQYWTDFNHFMRVARLDAAQTAGNALLAQLEPIITKLVSPDVAQAGGAPLLARLEDQTLLDVVESSDYADVEETLDRAQRSPTIKDLAEKIALRVQEARIKRSRDRERILGDIQRLGEGDRSNANAVMRLKAAGQFAAPEMLAALLDEKRANLQPFILAAMVSVGRPLVAPLCAALPDLEPVPQGQIAQVLAEIGYPRALPYLKLVSENTKTDANTRAIVDTAYRQLARAQALPTDISAAELFFTLAQNAYNAGSNGDLTVGYDPAAGKGVVWTYDRGAGLIDIRVPGAIFPDVLAMRASHQALALNPRLDQALSVWLMANQRRANRLPGDETDPSYATTMQAPSFYLLMSGPLRQHDVLSRALRDSDAALALNAIDALAQTAGTDALVNRKGTAQPLIAALSYPDRRVRFAAAFALTNARPKVEFEGSFRVVPVLAEAVRQTDVRYAVVLGQDQTSLNRLAGIASELGYKPIVGLSLRDVGDAVNAGPGVDLIVTDQGLDQVVGIYNQSARDYKLAAVPIVALVSPGTQIELTRRYDRDPRMRATVISDDAAQLRTALETAAKSFAGKPISADEAEKYALTALRLLQEIAVSTSGVFHTSDAQPAVINALTDKRPTVLVAAGTVLAALGTDEAQRRLADTALDATLPAELRIQLLGSLALSGTRFGCHLNDVQLGKLLDLTKTATGDLALAAARTHGAMTQPTADVVQMIEK